MKGTCSARIGWVSSRYGFEALHCTQRVGLRHFESLFGTVWYCSVNGHEANVRRQFAEVEPVTVETPLTRQSWSDAGWTEAELREAFGV